MTRARGFTLIEVLIVLSLTIIVASFGLFMSMDSFHGTSFRSDRDLVIALLQHARAQSMSNICGDSSCTDGAAHGVHIDGTAHTYTAFEGSTYTAGASQNQVFSQAPTVTSSGATDIVFTQLTGSVGSAQTITLTGNGKTSVITIGTNGRISWTN